MMNEMNCEDKRLLSKTLFQTFDRYCTGSHWVLVSAVFDMQT